MANESPQAGWYEDPQDPSRVRFWDGTAWSRETLPREHLADPVARAVEVAPGFSGKLKAAIANDREHRIRAAAIAQAHTKSIETRDTQELESLLGRVVTSARTGDIVLEESERSAMIAHAKGRGGGSLVKVAEAMLLHAQAAGTVRIGATLIGVVKPEGFFTQYARKEALTKVQTGAEIVVLSDRIFHKSSVYPLDEFTSAQVYLDGLEQITQRPTLTRMALLSPLPGSALIPGLALQKKKKNDMRHAEFLVGGPNWSVSTPVNPDSLQEPRRIAQMINSSADVRARSVQAVGVSQAEGFSPLGNSSGGGVIDQLEKLGSLRSQRLISVEEFEQLKAALLMKGDT
jgi:hypothetical protein